MILTARSLEQAYFDNLRGLTTGMSEAEAQEMGAGFYQALEAIRKFHPDKADIVLQASEISCGECAEVIPCGIHTRRDKNGLIYTVGY